MTCLVTQSRGDDGAFSHGPQTVGGRPKTACYFVPLLELAFTIQLELKWKDVVFYIQFLTRDEKERKGLAARCTALN